MSDHYGVNVSNRMKWATRVVVAPFALMIAAFFLVRWIGPQWQADRFGEKTSPVSWFAGGLTVVGACVLFRASSLQLRKRSLASANMLAALLAAAVGLAAVVLLKHSVALSGQPFACGTFVGTGISLLLLNKWGVFRQFGVGAVSPNRIKSKRHGSASAPRNEPKHRKLT